MRRYLAIEWSRKQGRDADNRPLLKSGEFGVEGQFSEDDVQTFVSIDSALATANSAPNRRLDCWIEAVGQSRRSRA